MGQEGRVAHETPEGTRKAERLGIVILNEVKNPTAGALAHIIVDPSLCSG